MAYYYIFLGEFGASTLMVEAVDPSEKFFCVWCEEGARVMPLHMDIQVVWHYRKD